MPIVWDYATTGDVICLSFTRIVSSRSRRQEGCSAVQELHEVDEPPCTISVES